MVARQLERGRNEDRLLNGYGISFWGDEKALELDSGNGCTYCRYTECHELYSLKWLNTTL